MKDYPGMITIQLVTLWPHVHDCCLCGKEHTDKFVVGYYCGPTLDEIGKPSTEYSGPNNIVGWMSACQPCHDKFYGIVKPEPLEVNHDQMSFLFINSATPTSSHPA
jgi:hypothetical protein